MLLLACVLTSVSRSPNMETHTRPQATNPKEPQTVAVKEFSASCFIEETILFNIYPDHGSLNLIYPHYGNLI